MSPHSPRWRPGGTLTPSTGCLRRLTNSCWLRWRWRWNEDISHMRAQIHFAWLICWGLGQGAAFAEPATNQSPLTPATNAVSPAPPMPPLPKSRVAYFRELLAMSPAELEIALARTPEPNRKVLQAKLREYTALPPEEREASLRATELRWYLRPLMEKAPTNRTAQVASIPAEYRALVEERLKQWDAMSPETQKEVLEN